MNRKTRITAGSLRLLAGLALVLALFSGCATRPPAASANSRQFWFHADTFTYPNDLVWEYGFDQAGRWKGRPRLPRPAYTHHCFVVARAAKQFYYNAVFAPDQPCVETETYRALIQRVMATNPRRALPAEKKIVIPDYANLREFSRAQEPVLKAECGGAWQSYVQRGHWRVIFPFSRAHQKRTAEGLFDSMARAQPTVLHLLRFPQLTINHAVLAFDAEQSPEQIDFLVYDPNQPESPSHLTYNRASRTFSLPANDYFPGGRVDVYPVFDRWNY
ncbi:MAG TPA: hypothetical protein VN673_17230 [Clostridia bacterium]|nr:hypothetical protein [Clostridia bacterium]